MSNVLSLVVEPRLLEDYQTLRMEINPADDILSDQMIDLLRKQEAALKSILKS